MALLTQSTTRTNSFIFTTNTNLIANTLNANVFVTDGTGHTANSTLSDALTVNAAPSITLTTTPLSGTVDAGKTITYNALVTEEAPHTPTHSTSTTA